MSFTFNCPHCQQKIEAEDEWIGQDAECPSCGKAIKVEKNKPLITLKPIKMSFTFNCPHCQQKIEAEDEWIGQDAECPSRPYPL